MLPSRDCVCVGTCWNIFHQRSQLRNPSNHIHWRWQEIALGVCWTRGERTSNRRGLYMTSLPLKGHPAAGVSVERLLVVALVSYTKNPLCTVTKYRRWFQNSDWWLSTWSALSFLWFQFSARSAGLWRERFRLIWVFDTRAGTQKRPSAVVGSEFTRNENKNKTIGNGLSCASARKQMQIMFISTISHQAKGKRCTTYALTIECVCFAWLAVVSLRPKLNSRFFRHFFCLQSCEKT